MPGNPTTIDPAIIQSLLEIEQSGQPGFLSQVIQLFIQSTPEQIRDIGLAIQKSNSEALKAIAHSLKSSSAGVGAAHMSELCKELEELATVNLMDSGKLNEKLSRLKTEFEKVCRHLQKYQTVQD